MRRGRSNPYFPSAVCDLSSAVGDLSDVKLVAGDAVELRDPVVRWSCRCDGMVRLYVVMGWSCRCDGIVAVMGLRLDPSIQAVQLDSLAYSEMLRQSGTACIDSFWEFVSKVDALDVMHGA